VNRKKKHLGFQNLKKSCSFIKNSFIKKEVQRRRARKAEENERVCAFSKNKLSLSLLSLLCQSTELKIYLQ
jgi:hypothetical protein